LKDKAPSMMLRGHAEDGVTLAAPHGPEADAVAALVKLGYSPSTASEAVARAGRDLGEHAAIDALIKEALKGMGR
jgi:Holliday junction DNA helicase RuvA